MIRTCWIGVFQIIVGKGAVFQSGDFDIEVFRIETDWTVSGKCKLMPKSRLYDTKFE